MNNSFGHNFIISIWGASHAPQMGISIEGVPAGIPISEKDFEDDIRRRKPLAKGTTPRHEADIPILEEGLCEGMTTGGRLQIIFRNENTRSKDYSIFEKQPRPSHVDLVARRKYGPEFDLRGGGIFSGRLTLPIVAAGVVAKKLLKGVTFSSEIIEIGGCRDKNSFDEIISKAQADGDSVGGVIECRVDGLPFGYGEPYFDSLESVAAHLLFSIPAVKGVEFGSGFEGIKLRGSQRNDIIIDGDGHTLSNNEGGVNGGISNGNQLVVRVAIKPTASISKPQDTYSFESGSVTSLKIEGRHDACIALRAGVVIEAAMAIVLADLDGYIRNK